MPRAKIHYGIYSLIPCSDAAADLKKTRSDYFQGELACWSKSCCFNFINRKHQEFLNCPCNLKEMGAFNTLFVKISRSVFY